MKYRKLRIAWSVAWGVACLLLIALWVRSYWWVERVEHFGTVNHTSCWSACGILGVEHYLNEDQIPKQNLERLHKQGDQHGAIQAAPVGWTSETYPVGEYYKNDSIPRFRWQRNPYGFSVLVPYWFMPIVSVALAAVSWLPWRFSLRTLLIGMTVAAIGLGWIVYALRD